MSDEEEPMEVAAEGAEGEEPAADCGFIPAAQALTRASARQT